jgi:hypothetical protein
MQPHPTLNLRVHTTNELEHLLDEAIVARQGIDKLQQVVL